MKVLITGAAGFYGSYLAKEFKANNYEVICTDLEANDEILALDILDGEMVQRIIVEHNPDAIVNMAGQANVGLSWKKPQFTVELNTVGLINVLEAVKNTNPAIRVITIGSSDEYGSLKEKGKNVTEDMPIIPITPYAISKQAQELFAKLYVHNYEMNICMVRQFNLGGAGQAKGFMISDFASEIADVEFGRKGSILVGNLDSERDFTHVKDACRAIRLIVEKGKSGEIYNICSGKTYKASDVLNKMISQSKVKVEILQDPNKIRPSDTPVICGNHDKLTLDTGWTPQKGMDEIIADELEYWRNRQG